MWTEQTIKEYTHKCLDKCMYDTPSAITLKSFYKGNDFGEKYPFGEIRAIVEKEIQIHKQKLKYL